MPIEKYDKYYGGKSGSAGKALASMKDQYGEKKGEQVFYATKNKRKAHPLAGEMRKMQRQKGKR